MRQVSAQFAAAPIRLELSPSGVLIGKWWARYLYTDARLAWNPDDFSGLDKIRIPAYKLWVPDVMLYNRVDSPSPLDTFRSPEVRTKIF